MKKVLGSVHEMSMGGNVVVFDAQNEETNERTRINYEQGQRVIHVWAPVKEGEAATEMERALKGNRFAMLATESENCARVFTGQV